MFSQFSVNSQRLLRVIVAIVAIVARIKVACTIIVAERNDIGIATMAASTTCVNR
jgi:hypothetical protein